MKEQPRASGHGRGGRSSLELGVGRSVLGLVVLAIAAGSVAYWQTGSSPREPGSAAVTAPGPKLVARPMPATARGRGRAPASEPMGTAPLEAEPSRPAGEPPPDAEALEPSLVLDEPPSRDDEPSPARVRDVPLPAPAVPSAEDNRAEDERVEAKPHEAMRQRQLDLTLLVRWRQPGMCPQSEQATLARNSMLMHFRRSELAGGAGLYMDPRLPDGAQAPVLGHLEDAQHTLQLELQLSPGLPDVFLYQDAQLLLAAACTNADVVAYYDGSLHVVATRADLGETVLHELTHHTLVTAGILGPAWLHEGVAMHVARETWWKRQELLQRLAERPFSLATMETTIPYTLETEQAVSFYVQAAAMVACAIRNQPEGIRWLLGSLRVLQTGNQLSYELPALALPSAFRACIDQLRSE